MKNNQFTKEEIKEINKQIEESNNIPRSEYIPLDEVLRKFEDAFKKNENTR